jgi:hypothetical protein
MPKFVLGPSCGRLWARPSGGSRAEGKDIAEARKFVFDRERGH